MAVIKSRWSKPPVPRKEVPPTPKYKKVVKKKEVVVEPTPIVEEEMTLEDILTTLEKKS